MSSICKDCNAGITSSDHKATEYYCSACMLEDAEAVINTLTEEGRDAKEALNLAFEYFKKYDE